MGRIVALFLCSIFVCVNLTPLALATSDDWLRDAYKKSHNPGDGEPYSFNAEARDLFDTQIDVINTVGNNIDGDSSNNGIATADSVFVRLTRFMLQAAVVLAVPMLIFSGIKIMLSLGDKAKLMEAIQQIAWVAGGLLIALMSVMIIYLVTSLARSSLGGI